MFNVLAFNFFQFNVFFYLQDRITLAEKNERLQSQLKSLKEDLASTRDDQVFIQGLGSI